MNSARFFSKSSDMGLTCFSMNSRPAGLPLTAGAGRRTGSAHAPRLWAAAMLRAPRVQILSALHRHGHYVCTNLFVLMHAQRAKLRACRRTPSVPHHASHSP